MRGAWQAAQKVRSNRIVAEHACSKIKYYISQNQKCDYSRLSSCWADSHWEQIFLSIERRLWQCQRGESVALLCRLCKYEIIDGSTSDLWHCYLVSALPDLVKDT